MTKTTDPKVFEKRLVDRLIKRGAISAEDYEQHLASLPDLADQALPIESELEVQEVQATGHHPEEED